MSTSIIPLFTVPLSKLERKTSKVSSWSALLAVAPETKAGAPTIVAQEVGSGGGNASGTKSFLMVGSACCEQLGQG